MERYKLTLTKEEIETLIDGLATKLHCFSDLKGATLEEIQETKTLYNELNELLFQIQKNNIEPIIY